MVIDNVEFLTSVASFDKLPTVDIEIAIAGKSNVGKSSFINFISGNSKLARTSKDPGRTRLINYFKVNRGQFYFVDLPGYGYAEVSRQMKEQWGKLMNDYLSSSPSLKHVFLLLDVRHNPGEHDLQLIHFLYYYNIPYTIVATKCDKLSRAQLSRQLPILAAGAKTAVGNIIPTSALAKTGKDEVLKRIEQILFNDGSKGDDSDE